MTPAASRAPSSDRGEGIGGYHLGVSRPNQPWTPIGLLVAIAIGLAAVLSGALAQRGPVACCGCCEMVPATMSCGSSATGQNSNMPGGCPLCPADTAKSANASLASSRITPLHGCTHDCCGKGGSTPGREPSLPMRAGDAQSKLAFGPPPRFFGPAFESLASAVARSARFSRPVIAASGSSRLAIFGRRNT